MFEVKIRDVPVKFPFEPYQLQRDYMEKVIDCLQNETNGVLESPTGTGKTLSLLCSSLAWLEKTKAQLQLQRVTNAKEGFEVDGLSSGMDMVAEFKATSRTFLGLPTIIYASRTHSQLSQAVNELKRTAYKYMSATVLGSREQTCINPELKNEQASFKIQMCKLKVQTKSCTYYYGVDKKHKNPAVFKESVVDIEDLVKLGEKNRFCPYFMNKELKKDADIIFVPYNYILDPLARKAFDINLENSIVILDEAHNIERICEDSASFQIKATEVALAIEDATAVMNFMKNDDESLGFGDGGEQKKDFTESEICDLKEILLKMEAELDKIELGASGEATFPADFIYKFFEECNISYANSSSIIGLLDRVIQFLAAVRNGPFQRSGTGFQIVSDLLRIVFMNPSEAFKQRVYKCYKVHVKMEYPPKKTADNFLSKATASKKPYVVLSYWCFSPGFGMNMLMGCGIRSLILTSGTLAPLNPLISELDLSVQVRLENPHIVKTSQVCVKIIPNGPDNEPLNCSFQNRDNPRYINSLGRTILNIVRFIPDGLLIFFPSYPIMQRFQEFWQANGIWSSLHQQKAIFVEPRDKNSFHTAMTDYYAKIKDPNCKGAIFMGVCRGKVSEGLDFIDANGRAVIIIGLPFPPLKDPRVVLKRQYLDRNAQDKQALRGSEWYSLEATRAVNQAIGRVIRHKNDYGAILLLDNRFNSPNIKSQLSKWLRDRIQALPSFGPIILELRQFYKNAEEMTAAIKAEAKENLGGSLNSTASGSNFDFSTSSISGLSSDSSFGEVQIYNKNSMQEENPIKRKKIVIVPNKKTTATTLVTSSKEYMAMVKKTLDKDSFTELARGLQNYSTSKSFEQLKLDLDHLFLNRYNVRYLIGGLEMFIMPCDKEEFKEYWAKMRL